VDSFTRDSLVRSRGSQAVASLERLEAFSDRVRALARVVANVYKDPAVSASQASQVAHRVELSMCQALEAFSRGRSSVAQPGLWLPGRPQGADVRKDSTPTSLIT